MEKFGIPHPCNEDFSKMTLTERGAFCSTCSTDTFNFTNKSHLEIKSILRDNIGKEICGRILPGQIEAINSEFEAWSFRSTKSFQSAFLYTLIAVFGLSLFSCQDQRHEIEIDNFQRAATEIANAVQNQISLEAAANGLMAEQVLPELQLPSINWQCMAWDYPLGGVMYMPVVYEDYLYQPVIDAPIIYQQPIIEADSIAESITLEDFALPEYEIIAFPNPTAGITTLELKNLEKARYQIDLYDLNGKHYLDIFSGKIEDELVRQEFDMSDLPTGIYLVTITGKKFKETVRVSKI